MNKDNFMEAVGETETEKQVRVMQEFGDQAIRTIQSSIEASEKLSRAAEGLKQFLQEFKGYANDPRRFQTNRDTILRSDMRKHFSKPRKLEVKDLDEPVDNKYANLNPENDIFNQTPTEDEVEEVLEASATGN